MKKILTEGIFVYVLTEIVYIVMTTSSLKSVNDPVNSNMSLVQATIH